ncbi:MAG: cyclic nucleotide-binding domain-containing protein [Rhodospirillales bacterium]|nr:cyclic nucleotide-binding domain-containing protein [Rhodospirillales bacterium]MBT4039380.1 cyclic nucleotide-binding domain-containing protein [Rhodospirillales bacterium]MBT4627528.1 cyclic nucleotide-binding domain-containing protein [Rhodospirillales bacterium]MBT5352930.1 cyclic nucleotide-binding domain-containing protein [Rhodospirillales bacterium]MBT5520196.1 cyclic nucleotide-binding domain-containing protein [Rhodospirillales bacterium]
MARNKKSFEDGEIIFHEGDPGRDGYVILKGRVALSKDTAHGNVEIEVLEKSDRFGEVGVMNGGLRTLSATAVGKVTVELVDQDAPGSPMLPAVNVHGPAVPAVPVKPPLGQGWLDRILNFVGNKSSFIEVRIVPFHGPSGPAFTRSVATVLGQCDGIRVKMLSRSGTFAQKTIAKANIGACIGEGRQLLHASSGDLLIWGVMSSNSETANLHLVSAIPHDEDMPGSFNGYNELPLPINLDDSWIALLNTVVLAGVVTNTTDKTNVVQANLEAAIEEGAPPAQRPPRDMSQEDRANLLVCLANAVSMVCLRLDEAELLTFSTDLYKRAIELISEEDHAMLWGMTHKQLGSILYLAAERNHDNDAMRQAADAFEAATKAISRRHLPREWAIAQNKFGLSLYKLDLADALADTDMLKSSITAYCAAMQVYTRFDTPDRWADVMNNYALTAQVLGEHRREPRILEKAVTACRNALTVRRRHRMPHQWASTQNTLGSALFLLGKLTTREDYLDSATDAFRAAFEVYMKTGARRNANIVQRNLIRVDDLRKLYHTKAQRKERWADVVMDDDSNDANDADWWRDNVVREPEVDESQKERYSI